ncbi:sigma-70 family RNA polymerase sigma factor [Chitinophaga sp.]|uniref:RNA polymerase sigma factor n=1 Tax=Chitinophaga sp. TaxID=1869181 RepID=UPI0031CFBBD8
MADLHNKVQQEIDQLYKQHYGKMVASLLRFSKEIDLETAEDLVQDAFAAALCHWEVQLPDNPAGWIFSVCRNKALNKLRDDKKFLRLHHAPEPASPAMTFSADFPDDEQLRLLFACAHPDLAPKVQVVITLKYVINFKVATIASLLGMTIDGVDKLLLRARQKIKEEKILLITPAPDAMQQRLPIVHKIIYLIFNEGHTSAEGKTLLREELCEEALILNKAILDSHMGNIDTCALYSLMLFNSARFKARFDENGELIDLEQQDRSLWNQDLIRLGYYYFNQSKGTQLSAYHVEAYIAYLHSTATSFATTDWKKIAQLYKQLLPNPFVELNYAIALYYAGEVDSAFELLAGLQRSPFMNSYYLLNATLGKLYMQEGDHAQAAVYFSRTLTQARSSAEVNYIRKMLSKLNL